MLQLTSKVSGKRAGGVMRLQTAVCSRASAKSKSHAHRTGGACDHAHRSLEGCSIQVGHLGSAIFWHLPLDS